MPTAASTQVGDGKNANVFLGCTSRSGGWQVGNSFNARTITALHHPRNKSKFRQQQQQTANTEWCESKIHATRPGGRSSSSTTNHKEACAAVKIVKHAAVAHLKRIQPGGRLVACSVESSIVRGRRKLGMRLRFPDELRKRGGQNFKRNYA